MTYKENKPEKLYYTIGEVAELFDVNTSLIRFWEKEFDVIKPKKNKKGNRLFTMEDIENIKSIYYLVKEKGHTLDGAKQKLKTHSKTIQSKVEVLNSLQTLRGFLEELKNDL